MPYRAVARQFCDRVADAVNQFNARLSVNDAEAVARQRFAIQRCVQIFEPYAYSLPITLFTKQAPDGQPVDKVRSIALSGGG